MAPTATTRIAQETVCPPTLCLAFALGVHTWTVGCTTGAAQRPRERPVPAGDCHTVLAERRRAKRRFGLPAEARGGRGYAAGRAGWWLHRFCVSQGIEHSVGNSASIAGNRRYRRATTDRLEGQKLRTRLLRHAAGEQQGWSVGRVPSVAGEDRRQWPRELLPTQRARPRVSNRLTGRLASGGMRLGVQGARETPLAEGRPWDGAPRPAALRARRPRAGQQGPHLTAPHGRLEAERRVAWRPSAERGLEQVRQ